MIALSNAVLLPPALDGTGGGHVVEVVGELVLGGLIEVVGEGEVVVSRPKEGIVLHQGDV